MGGSRIFQRGGGGGGGGYAWPHGHVKGEGGTEQRMGGTRMQLHHIPIGMVQCSCVPQLWAFPSYGHFLVMGTV